jgi:hypothetical protein
LRAKSPSSPGWGAVSAEQLPFAWPEEGADIIGVDVLADIESIPSMATPEDLAEAAALIEKTRRKAILTLRPHSHGWRDAVWHVFGGLLGE